MRLACELSYTQTENHNVWHGSMNSLNSLNSYFTCLHPDHRRDSGDLKREYVVCILFHFSILMKCRTIARRHWSQAAAWQKRTDKDAFQNQLVPWKTYDSTTDLPRTLYISDPRLKHIGRSLGHYPWVHLIAEGRFLHNVAIGWNYKEYECNLHWDIDSYKYRGQDYTISCIIRKSKMCELFCKFFEI